MESEFYALALPAVTGILSLLATGMAGVLWYLYKEVKRDVKDLQRSDIELMKMLPETYVRKDVFAEHAKRVEHNLDLILRELKEKADKA